MDTTNRDLRRTASSWTSTTLLLLLIATTIFTGICRASPVASPEVQAAKVATTADKTEDEVVAVAVEVVMDDEDADEPVVFATPAAALVTTESSAV